MSDPHWTSQQIERALTTAYVGRPVHYWPMIGSTMDEARRLAGAGAPEGTMVIADEQTAGRGRLQRSWWAPPASSLLLTLVLCPSLHPRQMGRLTMICSLAVCDAIACVSGVSAQVKWPNDVLVGERKVCGILTELGLLGDRLDYALVGIGINVNVDLGSAPPLMAPATSLQMETGRPLSRLDLLIHLLSGIEDRYEGLKAGQSFHSEWAGRMATLGRHIQVAGGPEHWEGLATHVDEDGALWIRQPDGRTRRILAGDVTLRSSEHGA